MLKWEVMSNGIRNSVLNVDDMHLHPPSQGAPALQEAASVSSTPTVQGWERPDEYQTSLLLFLDAVRGGGC